MEPERIVGTRELRGQLSALLRLVANGQTFTTSKRHRPVARLIPANPSGERAVIERLAVLGSIRTSAGKPGASQAVEPRRPPRRATSKLVSEDRR